MIQVVLAYKAAIMRHFGEGFVLSFVAGIFSFVLNVPAMESADKVVTLVTHLVQLGIAAFGLLTAFYAFLGFRRRYKHQMTKYNGKQKGGPAA